MLRSTFTSGRLYGVFTKNPDGTSRAKFKVPLANGDKNGISAIRGLNLDRYQQVFGKTTGVALENVNSHYRTLSHSQLPNAVKHMAAANLNLLDNGNHKVYDSAFIARTVPHSALVPNFNRNEGGAEYKYKKNFGAGVVVAHTPFFYKNHYSAMGKLNVFRGRDLSLDFKAGASKYVSPFLPKTNRQPSAGIRLHFFVPAVLKLFWRRSPFVIRNIWE